MKSSLRLRHPLIRALAIILGIVGLIFAATGAYALCVGGWNGRIFSATLTMFVLSMVFLVGGIAGPGKLPSRFYSPLGG